MATKPPDAFLSYTRFDDEYHHGAISEFRRQLCMAVQAVTGEPFEIFQDMEGIGLGESWLGKLDHMIANVHFFIPILTPNYFKSQACRDELHKFLEAERAVRRRDLILPIYYIRCPVLEEQRLYDSDRLAKIIHQRQRWEWRELRLHSFRTRKVRLAIEELALAIQEARERGKPRARVPPAALPTAPAVVFGGPATSLKRTPAPGAIDQHWSDVRERLREEFGDTTYKTWLEPLTLRGLENDRVLLTVPTRFLRDWVAAHYADRIRILWRRANPAIKDLTLTVAHRAPTEPGTVFRDRNEPWCPEMVIIPPGEFMMGSPEDDLGAEDGEKPQHLVRIGYTLAVGRYPVTFTEYDHYCESSGKNRPKDWGWGRESRPVIDLSWEDAKAYVVWLSNETGQPYRLLSEAEWEYAARAGTTTRYSWGNDIAHQKANYGGNVSKTTEVGSYLPNPWGLHDMHGNVWEWVEDCFNLNYQGAPIDGSAWIAGHCSDRMVRGGAWDTAPSKLRTAQRTNYSKVVVKGKRLGFRVARTLRAPAIPD